MDSRGSSELSKPRLTQPEKLSNQWAFDTPVAVLPAPRRPIVRMRFHESVIEMGTSRKEHKRLAHTNDMQGWTQGPSAQHRMKHSSRSGCATSTAFGWEAGSSRQPVDARLHEFVWFVQILGFTDQSGEDSVPYGPGCSMVIGFQEADRSQAFVRKRQETEASSALSHSPGL